MKYGLEDKVIKKIQSVFAAFPQVQKVILYGSRAKGNYKPGSDIDLSLKGENLNLSTMNRVSLMLDDLLLPYMFDLSVLSHIKDTGLLEHIDRVGIEFYNRN
ncbi:MAG: nucleotidyltransferase domain-containing protein [Daejeonella sp.]